jgi:hypothetical protein
MVRLSRLVALGLAIAVALPAVAQAQRFRGHRYIRNPWHSVRMTSHRAHWASVRIVKRVFAVRPGTTIYACAVHDRHVGGCDFAFTSRLGNYTCGNTVVRAGKTRFRVRYTAFNRGCGDF